MNSLSVDYDLQDARTLQELENLPESPTAIRREYKQQEISPQRIEHFLRIHKRKHLKKCHTGKQPTGSMSTYYPDELIHKKQYLTITKQHHVRDIQYDTEGNILLTSQSSVQKYDINGVFVEKVFINRVTEPWGLQINSRNGHILISDYTEHCVKEFNTLGIVVQEYGPVPSPKGIAISDTGYVFVCSEEHTCVYVFDREGNLVTIIGDELISPTHVLLHDDMVLVSDQSAITGYTLNDEIAFVYKHSKQTEFPSSLAVDHRTGYILATCYNEDMVIALNPKEKRAKKMKTIKRPTLCLTSVFGQLLIAEQCERSGGSLLKMFKLK